MLIMKRKNQKFDRVKSEEISYTIEQINFYDHQRKQNYQMMIEYNSNYSSDGSIYNYINDAIDYLC